jgi:cell division septation protein DedD
LRTPFAFFASTSEGFDPAASPWGGHCQLGTIAVALALACALLTGHARAASVAEGVESFKAGNFARARKTFTEKLGTGVEDPRVYYYAGRLESDAVKAQSHFRTVVDRWPSHALADDALFEIARQFYGSGLYFTARSRAVEIIEKYPRGDRVIDARLLAAQAFLAAGRHREALKAFDAVPKGRGATPAQDLRANVGAIETLLAAGEHRKVVARATLLTRKVEGSPHRSVVLVALMQAHRALGQTAAVDSVRAVLKTAQGPSEQGAGARLATAVSIAEEAPETPRWWVQVGAFARPGNAVKLRRRLAERGYAVTTQRRLIGDNLFTLVWVGPVKSREEAAELGKRLGQRERIERYRIIRHP